MKLKYLLKEIDVTTQDLRNILAKISEDKLSTIATHILNITRECFPHLYNEYYKGNEKLFSKKLNTFFKYLENGQFDTIENLLEEHQKYTDTEIIYVLLINLMKEICSYLKEQQEKDIIKLLFLSIILSITQNKTNVEIDAVSLLPSKKMVIDNFHKLKHKIKTISLIDIKNFKDFNIYYGFEAGNTIIFQIGKLLKDFFHNDLVVRFQNDEFLILSSLDIPEIKNKIDTFKIKVKGKIRIIQNGSFQAPDIKFETVIMDMKKYKNLDFDTTIWILYRGLEESRKSNNNLKIIEANKIAPYILQKKLHIEVINALKEGNIVVALQPVKNIFSNELLFKESLVRIKVNQTVLNAYQFIETIENKKTEEEIDKTVVKHCLNLLKLNKISSKISINLSAQFMENCFNWFLDEISRSNINPAKIIVELTERDDILKIHKIDEKLSILKKKNFSVFIDDFGVKYANYEIVRELPIDGIKIDGTIVRNILHNELDLMFVSHVIDIAKLKNKKVVAEFIESQELLNKLKEIGTNKQFKNIYGQGFLLGKPEIAK